MNPIKLRPSRNGSSIVFVHGILSGPIVAWENQSGSFWPRLVYEDEGLTDFGLYLFAYRADALSGGYSLEDAVDAMRDYLRLDGVLEDDRNQLLIFVCHSMGGIVARRYVVANQLTLVERKTKIAIFLVASPSLGAQYANFVAAVAPLYNAQLDVLRFSETNQWLNTLDRDFLNLKEGGKLSISGRELVEDQFIARRNLFRFRQIVPPWSGAKYFGNPIKIAGSDHISIAKPAGPSDLQHRLLIDFVKSFSQDLPPTRGRRSRDGTHGSVQRVDWLRLLNKDQTKLEPPPKRPLVPAFVVSIAAVFIMLFLAWLLFQSKVGIAPQPYAELPLDLISSARVVFATGPSVSDAFGNDLQQRLGASGILVSGSVKFNGEPNAVTSKLVYYNAEDAPLAEAIKTDLDLKLSTPIQTMKATDIGAKKGVIDIILDNVTAKR